MQFFEKMKPAAQKLKEGVEHVVAGAGEKLQESRLKSQYKALLKEKQEKLLALGAKVYTLHRGEGIGIDDLTVELAELDELETRLAAKQEEINAHGVHGAEEEEAPVPSPEPQQPGKSRFAPPDYQ